MDVLLSAKVEDDGSDSDCLLEYDAEGQLQGHKHIFLDHQLCQWGNSQPRLAVDGKGLSIPRGDSIWHFTVVYSHSRCTDGSPGKEIERE